MEELLGWQAEEAVRLYLDGREPARIAKQMGVPRELVYKAIENSGCEIRIPGPAPASRPRPKAMPSTFGNILRATRRLKDITLKLLADRTSINMRILRDLELGRREPTFAQVRLLGKGLDVDPLVLAGWVLRGESKPAVKAIVQA